MSIAFNQSTDKLNVARYQVVSATFTGLAEQTAVLTAANKLAVAGVTDVVTATDLLTSVLKGFGLEAEQATYSNDVLMTTVALGKTTVGEMSATWGAMIPFARKAGQTVVDAGAAFATLTGAGIKSAEASTFMKQGFDKLYFATGAAATALEGAGIKTKDLTGTFLPLHEVIAQFVGMKPDAIKKMIPDMAAATAVSSLVQNFENYSDTVKQFNPEAMTGKTTEAFERMKQTLDFQLGQMGKRWDAFWIQVMSGEAGGEMAGAIKDINKWFDQNAKVVDKAAGALGNLATRVVKGAFIPAISESLDVLLRFNAELENMEAEAEASGQEVGILEKVARSAFAILGEPIAGEIGTATIAINDQVSATAKLKAATQEVADASGQTYSEVQMSVLSLATTQKASLETVSDAYKRIMGEMVDAATTPWDSYEKRVSEMLPQTAAFMKEHAVSNTSIMDTAGAQMAAGAAAHFGEIVAHFNDATIGMNADSWVPFASSVQTGAGALAKSFGGSVGKMPKSFGSAITTMKGQFSLWSLPTKKFKIIGTVTTKNTGGPVAQKAGGGYIQGPAGIDKIPAMLTKDEFVINAKSSKKHSGLIEAINADKFASGGAVRGYASGGMVRGYASGGAVMSQAMAPKATKKQAGEKAYKEMLAWIEKAKSIYMQGMPELEQMAFESAEALIEINNGPYSKGGRAALVEQMQSYFAAQKQMYIESELTSDIKSWQDKNEQQMVSGMTKTEKNIYEHNQALQTVQSAPYIEGRDEVVAEINKYYSAQRKAIANSNIAKAVKAQNKKIDEDKKRRAGIQSKFAEDAKSWNDKLIAARRAGMDELTQLELEHADKLIAVQASPFDEEQMTVMAGKIDAYYEFMAEKMNDDRTADAAQAQADRMNEYYTAIADGMMTAFGSGWDAVISGQKKFSSAFLEGLRDMFASVIRMYAAELIAAELKDIGILTMAAIAGDLSALGRIAMITAAATTAIGGLKAIKFHEGGVVPGRYGGGQEVDAKLLPGEGVASTDQMERIVQAIEGGGGGDIHVNSYLDGDLLAQSVYSRGERVQAL